MEDIMVVSEIGEQWSPNTPPESRAPVTSGIETPMAEVMGTAMGNIIPQVPKDVPVEKAIKPVAMKMTAGRSCGCSNPLVNLATHMPVPSSLQMFPMAKAIIMSIPSPIRPPAPLKNNSVISVWVRCG